MPRELGEKSAAILDALRNGAGSLSAAEVAAWIGDDEDGAEERVKALLRNLLGKGLVHQPERGLWAAGPAPVDAPPAGIVDLDGLPVGPRPRRITRAQAAATADALRPALDARARNSGRRGPKDATRIQVPSPVATRLADAVAATEIAISTAGEVLVLSHGAVVTRLSATVAQQVATVVMRLAGGGAC